MGLYRGPRCEMKCPQTGIHNTGHWVQYRSPPFLLRGGSRMIRMTCTLPGGHAGRRPKFRSRHGFGVHEAKRQFDPLPRWMMRLSMFLSMLMLMMVLVFLIPISCIQLGIDNSNPVVFSFAFIVVVSVSVSVSGGGRGCCDICICICISTHSPKDSHTLARRIVLIIPTASLLFLPRRSSCSCSCRCGRCRCSCSQSWRLGSLCNIGAGMHQV
mmetsp:Transcript_15027/g.27251  ORF Transcript_15027/g.27251 Transcript_15027/m.27251 type:complete len:213 (+) Transcript_15027:82-720(+)